MDIDQYCIKLLEKEEKVQQWIDNNPDYPDLNAGYRKIMRLNQELCCICKGEHTPAVCKVLSDFEGSTIISRPEPKEESCESWEYINAKYEKASKWIDANYANLSSMDKKKTYIKYLKLLYKVSKLFNKEGM
jgi:hypothetical protein